MTKLCSVGVAALAAIAAAGCGGSSNHNAGYGAFDAQLNSLCSQANTAVAAASGASAKLDVADTYIKKFQGLTPPSQLKSIYDQWTSSLEQALVALKSGDLATAKTLDAQGNTLASSLGAGTCAKSSTG
jgi:ABC-type glycerol-3-phosphate transport system substrate-binding protein